MKHHLSIDIETYSSVPIGESGLYKYAQSSDFEILLIAYSLDGGPVELIDLAQGDKVPLWFLNALHSDEYIKHAYNAAFEWYCLSRRYGLGMPVDQWRCTMLHGLYCGYTAGLDATGKALGLPQDKQKMTAGKTLIRYFCLPCAPTKSNGGRTRNLPHHDPAKWELFREYNRQDVVTEMEIERLLSGFPVPEAVQDEWVQDQLINARGVALDTSLIAGALYCDQQNADQARAEARELTALENPNSREQLLTWLQGMGVPIADLRGETVKEGIIEDFLEQPVPADWSTWKLEQRVMYWQGAAQYTGELVPRTRVCALEIWCEAMNGDPRFIKNSDAAEINSIVTALPGWKRMKNPSRFGYCKLQRGFEKGVTK